MKNAELAKAWSSQNAVNYYRSHRNSINDLYGSEEFFIESVLKKGKTLLDVGCATGGFSKIVKTYNENLEYTGIDISPRMISEAKECNPEDNFFLCNGEKIDFPDNSFDIVISFGVLHMTEKWEKLLAEALRVCREALLFDVRIVENEGICDTEKSYQNLEFDGRWDGFSRAPYVVVNIDEFFGYLTDMKPGIRTLMTYDYWHPVSKMTVSPYEEVCMAVLCLGKDGNEGLKITEWNLPIKPSYLK